MTIHRELGGARAVFTDRHGGASASPYATRNLADHVGDDPAAVQANRAALLTEVAAVGGPGAVPFRWVMPRHVHGTAVLVGDDAVDGRDGDGSATTRRDVALVAIGADCAPIAIANDTAWAAVHAGWRGAAAGVVEAGVAAVRALGRGPVHAVVGPCICAAHYEFGADALAELTASLGTEVAGTTATGTPAFDLRVAIRLAFARAGVDAVEVLDVCTVESADHFSYRRDGTTGRHGVVVTGA